MPYRYARMLDEVRLPNYYASPHVVHVLQRVETMRRYFDEVVDENPDFRRHYPEQHVAYMNILNDEIAPYALWLAITILSLEERMTKARQRILARHRRIVKARERKKAGLFKPRPR